MLAGAADLHLEIDGRTARLSGSGQRLILDVASAATVRDFLRISLPDLGDGQVSARDVPKALVALGLTLDIRDPRGSLLVIGAEAADASIRVPVMGRLRHVRIAGRRALLRLATSR